MSQAVRKLSIHLYQMAQMFISVEHFVLKKKAQKTLNIIGLKSLFFSVLFLLLLLCCAESFI